MPYQPSYGSHFRPASPFFSAVFPASATAAFIGMSLLTLYYLGSALLQAANSATGSIDLIDMLLNLVASAFLVGAGMLAATLVVATYMLVFGLPIAMVLRDQIRRTTGLIASVATAIIATLIAAKILTAPGGSGMIDDWQVYTVLLCFSLPAGLLYRRAVIGFLDEAEID